MQVTWFLILPYHTESEGFIVFSAYMKHNHSSLPSESIYVQVCCFLYNLFFIFNLMGLIFYLVGEIKRLKELVVDAKKEKIEIVSILVKSMLERDLFLYGATDLKQGSVEERVNELTNLQDARVQHANKK